MVVGFLLAAYSVVGNDALQTLGTFIASNQRTKWYWMWAGASGVLILVLGYGWMAGDVAWGRLDAISAPAELEIWHVLGPATLLVLTWLGVPVSTSFLVLSVFASGVVIQKMIVKSLLGWAVGAICAFVVWTALSRWLDELEPVRSPAIERRWRIAQWVSTGLLWSQWLIQDLANIVVFLPRDMGLGWFIFSVSVLVFGLAVVFRSGGGKIQAIMLEKTGARFVRSATIIDLVYALVLFVFKELNSIPMSTTWVFIGLLAGRELAIKHLLRKPKQLEIVFPMLARDFAKVFLGSVVSVGVVFAIHYLLARF